MPMMFKYPPFKAELYKQWKILQPLLPELIEFINDEHEKLRRSAHLNWEMHEINLIEDNRRENGDEFIPSDDAVKRMIEYLELKWDFISANIENL